MNKSREKFLSHKSKITWLISMMALVLISILLWFRLNTHEAQCVVSVKLQNIPSGLTVVGDWTKSLEVKISGSKSKIGPIVENNNFTYLLDLSGAKEKVNTIEIDQGHFPFPKGISIESVTPSFLTLRMDNEIKKSLPVKIIFSGKPVAGFFIADAVADPDEIILMGPESVLESLQQVKTKPMDVTDAQEAIQKEVMLDLPENVAVLFPEKGITASIFIEENIVIREMNDLPVQGKDTQWPYSITPSTISLKVKGHEKDLEKLSSKIDGSLEVFVDLKELKPGVYVRYATILLPGNVTLVGVEPTIFTVKLEKK
jgi:YbbR domain-containing protein